MLVRDIKSAKDSYKKVFYLQLGNTYRPWEVTVESIKQEMRYLQTQPHITKLHLDGYYPPEKNVIACLNELQRNTTITEIDLSGDGDFLCPTTIIHAKESFKTIEALCDLVEHNATLKKVTIRWNKHSEVGDKGFIMLANALLKNRSIEEIDLSGSILFNSVLKSTAACHALANVITSNATLTHLNISDNYLTQSHAEILLRALKQNHTLLEFTLDRQITGKAYDDMFELENVYFGILSSEQISTLNAILERNRNKQIELLDRAKESKQTTSKVSEILGKMTVHLSVFQVSKTRSNYQSLGNFAPYTIFYDQKQSSIEIAGDKLIEIELEEMNEISKRKKRSC